MPDFPVITRDLQTIFADEFHIQVPAPDTDLLDSGILDSLQFVELLMCLEREFGFKLAIESIELDDLRTLDKLAALLAGHVAADWQPPGAATPAASGAAAAPPAETAHAPATSRSAPARDAPRTRPSEPAASMDALPRLGVGAR